MLCAQGLGKPRKDVYDKPQQTENRQGFRCDSVSRALTQGAKVRVTQSCSSARPVRHSRLLQSAPGSSARSVYGAGMENTPRKGRSAPPPSTAPHRLGSASGASQAPFPAARPFSHLSPAG